MEGATLPGRLGRAHPPPFETLVERHGPAVLRFCTAQLGPDRGEDCFQETMLAALRAHGTVRDPAAARAWLFAIAARKVLDAHRARAREAVPVDDLEGLADARAEGPRDDELRARIRALPVKQRQAVTFRYLAGLTHREIGLAMGTSEEAARRNVHEAIRRLRRELGA